MADETTASIVSSAVSAAHGAAPESSADTTPTESLTEAAPVEETVAEVVKEAVADPKVSTDPAKKAPEKKVTDDEGLDPSVKKIVDEERRRNPGKEPRMPLSTHKTVLENARKQGDAHARENTQLKAKVATLEAVAKEADTWNRFIDQDPDGTIQRLAIMHPTKYAKYVNGGGKETPKTPNGSAPAEFPQPDVKSEDGSVGYSTEGLQKFIAWVSGTEERAVQKVRGELDSRFKPIETDRQQSELKTKMREETQKAVDRATQRYGSFFTDDFKKGKDSEVLKYSAEHNVSFEDALVEVLLPRIMSGRDKMREDVLGEVQHRSDAADKTSPSQTKTDPASTAPLTTAEIIRKRMAEARGRA